MCGNVEGLSFTHDFLKIETTHAILNMFRSMCSKVSYIVPFFTIFNLPSFFLTFLTFARPGGVWVDPIPSRAAVVRPPSVKLADRASIGNKFLGRVQ